MALYANTATGLVQMSPAEEVAFLSYQAGQQAVMAAMMAPQTVTRFQAYAALLAMPGHGTDATLFDTVNNALLAAKDSSAAARFAWTAWSTADVFTRNGALINSMAAGFSLDAATLDAIFLAASKITA